VVLALKRVAVTGASGMVGRHIMSALQDINVQVTASARTAPKHQNNFDRFVSWDLATWQEPEELNQLFPDVDAIVHAGAVVPKPGDNVDVQNLFDANVRGCTAIGNWAAQRKLPLINISGATVYDKAAPMPVREDAPKSSRGAGGFYGFTKWGGEVALDYFRDDLPFLVHLRPTSIYGSGMSRKSLIGRFLIEAGNDETISLTPPVDDRFGLVHAKDVARATVCALQKRVTGNFNIVGEKPHSLSDVVDACIAVTGAGRVMIEEVSANRSANITFDLDGRHAADVLKYTPAIDLQTGLAEVWAEMAQSTDHKPNSSISAS
tara:strand:+ start:3286 stop:4245 length:960 start_codon:yes stop_codon:yes gene_type:complete